MPPSERLRLLVANADNARWNLYGAPWALARVYLEREITEALDDRAAGLLEFSKLSGHLSSPS